MFHEFNMLYELYINSYVIEISDQEAAHMNDNSTESLLQKQQRVMQI